MPKSSQTAGAMLLTWLDRHNITQSALAKATGYSLKHINHLIHGRSRFTVDSAFRVADACGVSAHRLLLRQLDLDVLAYMERSQ